MLAAAQLRSYGQAVEVNLTSLTSSWSGVKWSGGKSSDFRITSPNKQEGMDPATANAIFKTSATNLNVMRSPAHAVAAQLHNNTPGSSAKSPVENNAGPSPPVATSSSGQVAPKNSGEKIIRRKFEEIYRATPVPMALQKQRSPTYGNYGIMGSGEINRYVRESHHPLDDNSAKSSGSGPMSSTDGYGRHHPMSSPPRTLYQENRQSSPQLYIKNNGGEYQADTKSNDKLTFQRSIFKRGSRHSGGSLINLPASSKASPRKEDNNKSNETSLVVDDDAVCACCQDGDAYEGNTILFCDNCNLSVHQECYGIPSVPAGSWFCNVCRVHPSKKPDNFKCEICSHKGGALKPLDEEGKWVHVLCANWIPEIYCIDTRRKEPYVLSALNKKRTSLKCFVCKSKGICVQCSYGKCTVSAHPMCAFDRESGFTKGFYCEQHRSEFDAKESDSSISPAKKHKKVGRKPKNNTKTIVNNKKNDSADNWSEEEKLLLYQAHASVPVTSINFWEQVAAAMDYKKSASDCQKKWFQSLESGDRNRKEKNEKMKVQKEKDLDREVTEANVKVVPTRKRIDRSCMQRIAERESIADKDDDVFDILQQKQVRIQTNCSRGVSEVSSEVIGRASCMGIDESPESGRATRSSKRISVQSSQNSWKALYAHKLAKRSESSTASLGDAKKIDSRAKLYDGSRKKMKKSYTEGNVSATISPSGRVRTTVMENSGDEIDDTLDEDEDDVEII